ncbi:MAG: tetraacyldisaccharide 4'-kinase [Gammaproteobacteria bacterium]|nr:tetraacyldisaccharide 4'-kinase [Gammaproteobacteria bacterium]
MKPLQSYWYSRSPLPWLLLPLAALFGLLAALRRYGYSKGYLAVKRFALPVIVVGNISVGGTGKTPLVIWLVERLRQAGYRPAVVSRGYGGEPHMQPRAVNAQSSAQSVGDEPLLIARRCGCPVVVCTDRALAVEHLLAQGNCNVVVADDGLQHYRLGRDIEIAVIDGERRFGNGLLLPAGPLREPQRRLKSVDLIVVNGQSAEPGECAMQLEARALFSLTDQPQRPLADYKGCTVHAVAGIGNPHRFFDDLRRHGLTVIEHPFPDHYAYTAGELCFDDALPVLMTEKDAVKYQHGATEQHWFLAVDAVIDASFSQRLLTRLAAVEKSLKEV